MLCLLIAIALLNYSSATPAWPELSSYNPVADAGAVVISGNARFTVLTDRVIRIEWSSLNSTFLDNATTAVLNRNLPVPKFTATTTGGLLSINTDKVSLQYKVGQKFSSDTLSSKGDFGSWKFDQQNTGNLLGTIKSLDLLGPTSLNCTENKNITVHGEDLHCSWGLISRDGWAVIDDSKTYALDSDNWWTKENPMQEDLYLFAHGLDFKGALADFVKISGKIAMPPKNVWGTWFTRWFNFNANDLRDIVSEYSNRHLPLDVLVLDMDWHVKPAWGSYTWDSHLFPAPKDVMLDYMKTHKGLTTLANIHDDNGIVKGEAAHSEAVKAMGLPSDTGDIPFQICTNQEYAKALEDAVLLPVEQDGIDYWWIDWQQGGNHGGCAGLLQNPTIWTNKIRATDHLRRGENKRGLVLARWGGLGSHRYQVGFSGDVAGVTWESLAYQPYFSMTSTNVGYGFWSHDIVGPGGQDDDKLELYTRWLQWATYSGVFRSHDRGSSAGSCAGDFPSTTTSNTCTVVKPWNVPLKYFKANRAALQRRAALVPLTYTLARTAYDVGLGPLRPMYYEYPKLNAAYNADSHGNQGQYFFGDDMVVSPITSPSSNATSYLASKKWWVPPGKWIEKNSHDMLSGNDDGSTFVSRLYALDEIPVLVRAGAVLTTSPSVLGDTIGVAGRQFDSFVHEIYPGAANGSSMIYEDDGATLNYHTTDSFARTTVFYSRNSDESSMDITVSTVGTYDKLPKERSSTEVHIVGGGLIKSVSLNGKDMGIQYSRYGTDLNTWSYCHKKIATILRFPSSSVANTQSYNIVFEDKTFDLDLSGIRGAVRRGSKAKAELDLVRTTPGAHKAGYGQLDGLALYGDTLARLAGTDVQGWIAAVQNKEVVKMNAVKEVENMKDESHRNVFVEGLLQ